MAAGVAAVAVGVVVGVVVDGVALAAVEELEAPLDEALAEVVLDAVVDVELVALTAGVEAAAVTWVVVAAWWPVAIHPAKPSTVSELATPVIARARFAG